MPKAEGGERRAGMSGRKEEGKRAGDEPTGGTEKLHREKEEVQEGNARRAHRVGERVKRKQEKEAAFRC